MDLCTEEDNRGDRRRGELRRQQERRRAKKTIEAIGEEGGEVW